MNTFRIAVTGGRDHELSAWEMTRLHDILAQHQGIVTAAVLLHGNCQGVDQEAARLAESWGFAAVPFEAPWDFEVYGPDAGRGKVQIGPSAGPLRNSMMLQAADLLVAFPGGRGTANCVKQARELGVEVVEVGR